MELELHTYTQQTFRRLMSSFSYPGKIEQLTCYGEDDPFWPLKSVCETLLDIEVGYHLLNKNDVLNHRIHHLTKANITSVEDADFVIALNNMDLDELHKMKVGTLEIPDDSATIIFYTDSSSFQGLKELTIAGPGIQEQKTIEVSHIISDMIERLQFINREHPLGIDLILINASGEVMVIPRTTKINPIN